MRNLNNGELVCVIHQQKHALALVLDESKCFYGFLRGHALGDHMVCEYLDTVSIFESYGTHWVLADAPLSNLSSTNGPTCCFLGEGCVLLRFKVPTSTSFVYFDRLSRSLVAPTCPLRPLANWAIWVDIEKFISYPKHPEFVFFGAGLS